MVRRARLARRAGLACPAVLLASIAVAAPDGTLGHERTLVTGLDTPDGMCIDMAGNLYVATWASTIEAFAADGAPRGSIPIPREATNCAFGGADRRSLFVTAQDGVYRADLAVPGIS